MNVLIYLGIFNRYKEIEIVNIIFYFFMAKVFIYKDLDVYTVIIFGILAILRIASWYVELHRKRGIWESMKEFDKKCEGFTLRVSLLERDYTETKRAVALLNNKQVLGAFQGIKK